MKAFPSNLFQTAVTSAIILVIVSVLLDANGELPFMGRAVSIVFTAITFIASIISSTRLLAFDSEHRVHALFLLVATVVLALLSFF